MPYFFLKIVLVVFLIVKVIIFLVLFLILLLVLLLILVLVLLLVLVIAIIEFTVHLYSLPSSNSILTIVDYFTPKRNFFYINTTYYYNIFLRKIQVKQAFLNKIINNG